MSLMLHNMQYTFRACCAESVAAVMTHYTVANARTSTYHLASPCALSAAFNSGVAKDVPEGACVREMGR